MTKKLSIKETEDLVFSNKIIQSKLGKYKFFFDKYLLGKAYTPLAHASIRCVLDFINLVDQNDLLVISSVLGYEVELPDLKAPAIKNFDIDIDLLEFFIQDASNYNEVILFRKNNKVGVTLWR